MSAWVKKRKICVSRLRSWSVIFCAQSRQSSPSGTSSGIQWICCWRFQNSNAHGYSNGLYCERDSRRPMSVGSCEFEDDGGADDGDADDGDDDQPALAGRGELGGKVVAGLAARIDQHDAAGAQRDDDSGAGI